MTTGFPREAGPFARPIRHGTRIHLVQPSEAALQRILCEFHSGVLDTMTCGDCKSGIVDGGVHPTTLHCVKLLGQRLMARGVDWQIAGLPVRIVVLNGYTALGIPITHAVG